MLKNITFSAEEELIRKARERAAARRTTLNDEFRRWLEKYAERPATEGAFTLLMERFAYVQPGRSFKMKVILPDNIERVRHAGTRPTQFRIP